MYDMMSQWQSWTDKRLRSTMIWHDSPISWISLSASNRRVEWLLWRLTGLSWLRFGWVAHHIISLPRFGWVGRNMIWSWYNLTAKIWWFGCIFIFTSRADSVSCLLSPTELNMIMIMMIINRLGLLSFCLGWLHCHNHYHWPSSSRVFSIVRVNVIDSHFTRIT